MNRSSLFSRVIRGFFFSSCIVLIGTIGYSTIENWTLVESFYMAVITLTTVGFGEVRPLSSEGRIFTAFFLLLGGGFILYMFTVITEVIVGGKLESFLGKRRMEKKITDLQGHAIVAGFGRIGCTVVKILGPDEPLLIIESDSNRLEELEQTGHPHIIGDATDEAILRKAGIEKAKALLAALPTDANNLYVTLTAKEMNPGITVVARADHTGAERRLQQAGADKVIAPYLIGARRMALTLARPTVTDFLESSICSGSMDRLLELEEIRVSNTSPLAGLRLETANLREKCNVILLSVKKTDGAMAFNPAPDYQINEGDILVVLAEPEGLDCLRSLTSNNST